MKKRRGTFFLIFLFLFSAPHNKRQGLGVMNVYCATVSPLLLLFFLEPPLFFIVKKKKIDSPGKRRVVCSYTNEKWPLRASPENYFYISSVASLFFSDYFLHAALLPERAFSVDAVATST